MCKEEGKAHSCRTRDTKRIADKDVSRGSEDYDGGVAHGSSDGDAYHSGILNHEVKFQNFQYLTFWNKSYIATFAIGSRSPRCFSNPKNFDFWWRSAPFSVPRR